MEYENTATWFAQNLFQMESISIAVPVFVWPCQIVLAPKNHPR
jgi:hypothetical protein